MVHHSGGGVVAGSIGDYKPFGGYRTAPTADDTDRGYTGHLHTDGIGLIYMNARFYVGSVGRFASADTLIPDPGSSQGFNRYAYSYNNPINLIDPSGHNPVCNHNGTICSDGAFDDGQSETIYGIDTTIAVINSWDILGMLYDPSRTEPLITNIIINNQAVGQLYAMPIGTQQSLISPESPVYKVGRFLSGFGIALDIIETILAPIPGAGATVGTGDGIITYFSGLLTGDNYLPLFLKHPDLPNAITVNQDVMINNLEAGVGIAAKGMGTVAGTVAAGPAGALAGFGLGAIVDAITSTASGIYDYGRYKGAIHNYVSAGVTSDGALVVYWPPEPSN